MVALILAGMAAGSAATSAADQLPANAQRLQFWREARFGMFIHWGPVSLKGTEIGWSRGAQVPVEEYDNLYRRFNPAKFNADEWVKVAKDAGMKYVIFTTKHHDGFCMFDTKQTAYNVMHTPLGRDVVKELAEACRKQQLAFGTYYSVCDWHHPDFPHGSPGGRTLKPNPNLDRYEQYLRSQVKELIGNYGPLLTLWFDVAQDFDAKRGKGVVDFVRSLQPDILVNNRCANPGDHDTPEQRVGGFNRDRPWETCMTICRQWAWKPNDQMKSFKQCIQTLLHVAGGDGNLLLNVGPMPDGRIEPRQGERLKEVGRWLADYGDGVYGTRGGPLKPGRWGASTCKGNRIYLFVMNWPAEGPLQLPPIGQRILAARTRSGGKAVVEQAEGGITVRLGEDDRDKIATVVELTVDGKAYDIDPVAVILPSPSVAFGKPAKASNVYGKQPAYGPDKAFDDDPTTRWATDAGTHTAWLEVDLGAPQRIGRTIISEACAGRVQAYELQNHHGKSWRTIHVGKTLGEDAALEFRPVYARRIRLNITEATEGPTIWEFQLLAPRR